MNQDRFIRKKKFINHIIISKQTMSSLISHKTAIQDSSIMKLCTKRFIFTYCLQIHFACAVSHFQFYCKKKCKKERKHIWEDTEENGVYLVVPGSVFFSFLRSRQSQNTEQFIERKD